MTTYEKLSLGIKVVLGAIGIALGLWVGSTVQDVTAMMEATGTVLERVETLVDMGPDAIADVGDGLGTAAETAGEGITDATINFLDKVRNR